MKTNHIRNFSLVKSCFAAFCDQNGLELCDMPVLWEHGGFSCSAWDDGPDMKNYRAVDAACEVCNGSGVDHCFSCGRNNEIDFEEV